LVFTYSGSIDIDAVGWYYGNSGFEIHKVGLKLPNELGIHDMSGNVREMCSDLHRGNGQAVGFVMNPNPAVIYRVERGSCYYDVAKTCRPVSGFPLDPNFASKGSGFRLVLPVE
jgi:formylglycine-generating enzyme required for sulfatase activity